MSKTTSLKKLSYSLLLVGALSPLSGALLAAPGQDLQPLSIDLSSVTTDGQTLSVSGTLSAAIANAGDTDIVSGFSLLAFEDINANGSYDSGVDQVLGTQLHSSGLPAGETANISVGITGTLSFAGNIIYVYADSEGDISEDDETNNLIHSGQSSQYIPPVGSFDPVLEWSWTSSSVEPSALNVMMTPSVIDLNGDDIPDVVFGSTASTGGGAVEVGFLRALSGADGSELFTVTDSSLRINTASSVAVGDIDLDGHPEIIACDTTGYRLIAFEHDGTYKWRTGSLEQINWGAPSIADLDSDGTPEIIIGRQVLDNTGNLLWSGSGARGTQSSTGPLSLVADINLDGSPDVVAGNTIYNADGTILWQASVSDGFNAVANFDADDYPEVALVSNGSVYLIDHDRNLIWGPVAIPGGGIGGPPTIADYDSDGEPEIGVAGASNYVVIETDGSIKWSSPTQDRSSNRTGSSVFDFDGDGSAEVVYRDELYLRVYRGDNGDVLFQTPMSSCTWYEYVLVADVDADGNAEIVAVANNNCSIGPQRGVYVFGDRNDNWVATRQIWNQHTYHITNINADGTIPVVEANNWQTEGLNNYRLNEFLPGEGSSTDAPDLIPSFVRQDQTNCPVSVNLTARVGNGGALTAPSGVNISFYQGDPTTGGTLLGVVPTTRSLAPGEFEDVTVIWNGPAVGLQDIFIVADDDGAGLGAVNEGDELNNVYDTLVSVCSEENPTVGNLYCRAKDTKISVSWDEFDSAVSYRVFRHLSSGSALAGEVEPAVLIDYDLTYGTTYTYTVSAVLASGAVTPESAPCSATPLPRSRVRNLAPVINSSPGLTALQDQAYAYDVDATDPEGTALVYSLALSPAGATIDAVSGLLQWTPGNGDVGEHLLTVVVQDAGGMTASQSWRLSVADVNDPPVITSLPVDSAIANLFYQYAVAATDPESDPITFALDAAPAGMSIDPATGLVTWTPAIAQVGSHGVTVRAGDGKGGFATQSYTLTVSAPANNPPSIDSTPVTSATEGAVYSYDVDASDADGDTLTYSLATAPAGMSIDSANGLISWTPTTAQVGSQSVSVQVEDGKGGSDTQNFDVTVDAIPNTPPTIDSTPVTSVTEGAAYSYDVDASDADGDTLSYSLTAAPSGMTIDSATGLIDWIPSAAQIGSHVVVVQVSDGNGGLTNQSFSVTVNPIPNTAPSIDSTPVTTATEGSAYSYDVNASDTDGDTLTYSLTTAPAGMSIDSASGLISWTPTAAQVGSQSVSVQVDDGNGGSASQSFSIAVDAIPNTPPSIDSTPVTTVTEGSAYSYDVNASDADGDSLSYSLVTAPSGMLINNITGLVSWTPTTAQIGAHPVSIEVDDGNGGTASQSFTLTVEALPNSAPTIDSTPVTSATEGTAYSYDVDASDADGDTLTYSLTTAPAGMSIDSASGLISWTPTAAQVGSQSVSVQVDDGNGGSASQNFSITVAAIPNSAPTIDSTPVFSATEGTAYSYDVDASDSDGDSLTYSLTTAPAGMGINSASGLISWTPTSAQVGSQSVTVQVDDGNGGSATQSFSISVAAHANNPPSITSSPVMQATANIAYSYAVSASDTDGDTLNYSLTTAPTGMSIDSASGLISWTPSSTQTGSHAVTVRVDDGLAYAEQSYSISVSSDALPLDVVISLSAQIIDVGSTTVATVISDGGLQPAALTLEVDGVPVALDGSGQAILPGDTIGSYQLVATASDTRETVDARSYYSVRDPADTAAPTVLISTPSTDSELTAPTEVIGTADDANLAEYKLMVSPADQGQYSEIAHGDVPVIGGVLGTFDPTQLENGIYDVALIATDVNGLQSSTVVQYQVSGDMKVGNFSFTVKDLSIPVAGIPITVSRTYDTRKRLQDLDFGYGWTVDYQSVKVEENIELGLNWTQTSTGGFFPSYCVDPVGNHVVTVTLPDGKVEEFDMGVTPHCNTLIPLQYVDPVFTARAGTSSTLVAEDVGQLYYNGGTLLDTGWFDTYDPQRYTLTTAEGYVYALDQNFGIRTVTDPNGNTLTYSSSGIAHSSGTAVSFARDGQGRITRITDPNGNQINYTYNVNGDLSAVTNQVGEVTQHRYNRSHGLTEYIDPRGITPARNIYDDEGRLVSIQDADGHIVEMTHDVTGRQEVVRDRLGNVTVLGYDDSGYVTTETDALGNTILYTRDERGNELSKTDALGNTVSKAFDVNDNPLSETDALGNTSTNTFSAKNQLLSMSDKNGNVTSNSYDSAGNLTLITDAEGNTINNSYDSSGNVTSKTDKAGHVTSYTYDGSGNKLTETDPFGNVISYGYDANGNLISENRTRSDGGSSVTVTTLKVYDAANRVIEVTDSEGHSFGTEYNPLGKPAAEIDKNGNRTEYDYDNRGNLIRTRYPDGSESTASYDAEGNKISEIDQAGNITTYGYDALNRLVRTVYADGSEVNNTYDAAGRLISVQDGSGNITSYEYDAVGQRTRVTDPLGNSTSITYDANGNQTSITDANGNITQYEYDALNRRIRTVFPDGTDITVGYDALGRKVAETDQAGVTTQYAYDALGRLTQVTDALGGITSYTYDELGNKLTQTDAEGRTTSWTYDNEGNVLSRTLPLGQTESFTYDGNGNKLTHTSFNGDTISFSYDSLNRLALKTYPDASTVAYSYSSTGKVIGITDSSGTTGYSYDNRDRLVRVDQPDGSYTAYGYDVNGNRTELTTLAGTVHYTFDALNRLETVEDLSGGITVYTYDAVGNRASVSYPNGTQALYSYDNLNRLTYLENLRSDASVISSYQYTLGATGNRLAIAEDTGRTVDYTYDLLYRLTQESVTDLVNGNSLVEYGYDAVGNRLSKTVDSLVTVNYVYDDNDRLLSEDTITYSYDANGNTLSKNDGSLTTYSYDYDGRLVQVQTPSSLLEYTYDDEGIRTSASVDGIVTKHLVDKNRDYAQVIEERDALDNLQVAYTYGDDLISQDRSGSTSYYHYDGLGSTRALSDASEATTDSYTYEAFGSLVRASGTTPNSYLFAGEQFNPNVGFYYLRARYMNPETGRFQTLDPFAGYAHMPLTLHKYLYAGLDPVFHTDPSGYMFGGFGSFAGLSISFSIRSSISTLSSVAGRNIITRILFGNPPKDFGIVGDFILDNAINAVLMELLSVHSSKSVFGTKAHSRLEKMIKGYKPHPDVDIEVEVFKLDGGKSASRRAKGSIGVDILVKYKGKPVVAFDLKTGAGFSKSKVGKISRRFGVGVIEVRVIPK